MARHTSLADKWRAHRRAMVLAAELGVTPREAECELIRRDSDERIADIRRRRAAEAEARRHRAEAPASNAAPWWTRD